MLSNNIKFIAQDLIVEDKDLHPIPCKLNIPKWYKKLEHKITNKTIKGCMPFLDTLTTGYILKAPIDFYIKHNSINDGERKTNFESPANLIPNEYLETININFHNSQEIHPPQQLGNECPFNQKNKNLPFHKILNPWIIKTPPGYSCLFLPPMNNTDDRFSIIPGIVDTDTFDAEINFPIIINGDKYPILETTIERGTPYVQVIPFKRDSWKMKIERKSAHDQKKSRFIQNIHILNNYKNIWWNKKSWK
jgi:hypothetical protein